MCDAIFAICFRGVWILFPFVLDHETAYEKDERKLPNQKIF